MSGQICDDTKINTPHDLDSEIDSLTLQIREPAKVSTPVASNDHIKCDHLKLPAEIVYLIKDKRKAREKMTTTRFETDKREYNGINKIVHKRINAFRNEKFEKFLSGLGAREMDDYLLWKATKHLKRTAQISLPIRDSDGNWAKNATDKVDILASHLENVFKPNKSKPNSTKRPVLTWYRGLSLSNYLHVQSGNWLPFSMQSSNFSVFPLQ